jgi:ribose 5-phosphate isomerase B
MKEPIVVASDHAGFELKQFLKETLQALQYSVIDLGAHSRDPIDYPDVGYEVAASLRDGRTKRAVLICGSGIGVSMAANRFPEIRAALVHEPLAARLSREHNDANVICFGGRMISPELARECLRVFLETEFQGGRHVPRVEKLSNPRTPAPPPQGVSSE